METTFRRGWGRVPFEVKVALVVLLLSFLYAVTFTNLVYISLVEQVIHPSLHLPRFAQSPHYHHPLEWLLLLLPAIAGWTGTGGSLLYLLRLLLRSR